MGANLRKAIFANCLFAISYFVFAKMGLIVSIPINHASPIWPAAGIALAAVLVYRYSVLPGIFLGSLFAEVSNLTSFAAIDLLIQGITALGVTLQAAFGAWLINSKIGNNNLLVDDRAISFFFLLTIISCITSATISAGTLWTLGILNSADFLQSWGIWWIGDAIGSMIFTPMILTCIAEHQNVWLARRKYILFPMLLSFGFVSTIFYYDHQQENQRIHNMFERQVELLHHSIQKRLDNHIAVNTALKAFYDSSDYVSRQDFLHFTEAVNQSTAEVVLEWLPKITQDQRKAWETVQQHAISELKPSGELIPAPPHALYYPITYCYPSLTNSAQLGLDHQSIAPLKQLMIRVIDEGKSLASPGIPLLPMHHSTPTLSTVMYAPIYEKHHLLTSVTDRQQALVGLVVSIFSVEEVIKQILDWSSFKELPLLLSITDDQQILFSNLPASGVSSSLSKTLTIEFSGRFWQVLYVPSNTFMLQQQDVNTLLLMWGFLLSALCCLGSLVLTGRATQTEFKISDRTQELTLTNQALSQEINKRQVQESQLRIAATTFESHEGIVVTDAKASILRVNSAFTKITGFSAEEIIGQKLITLSLPLHNASFFRNIYRALVKRNQWQGEIKSQRKNGEIFPEWLTITGVRDEFNKLTNFVAIFADISYQKAAEKEIHDLAFYDPLTNLPNRRLLLDRLHQEIAAAKRLKLFGALIFMDLDHFKKINDSLGHQVGDELLIQVAARLKSIIREEDTACRLGGDEFIIMVSGRYQKLQYSRDHAILLAEKIRRHINQPFTIAGNTHHFTSSMGITLYPEDDKVKPEIIIQQADTAMYRAKDAGRNGISFYHPDMQEAADKRLMLEQEMRNALNQAQFDLHYQPQVNAKGEIVSAEALIRWQHPEKGMISPAEFIPVAEDTQLILPIGNWVLRQTCQQIKQWDLAGIRVEHVAINVSSRQFRQPNFIEQVQEALNHAGILAERLVIELTEGSVIQNIDDTIDKMRQLRDLGVRISIDDFGTGYSSLSYLKKLPLSQLKIDQSFVRDITLDPNDAVIVETIINMAQNLGLNVIAEGVENQEQIQFLLEKGCVFFQGYFFSRPLPAELFKLKYASNSLHTGD